MQYGIILARFHCSKSEFRFHNWLNFAACCYVLVKSILLRIKAFLVASINVSFHIDSQVSTLIDKSKHQLRLLK